MNLEIESEQENPLLHRKDIKFRLSEFNATPSKAEVIKLLIAKTAASEERIVINKIGQGFGKKEAVGYVKIYESEAAKKKIEGEKRGKEEKQKTEQQ